VSTATARSYAGEARGYVHRQLHRGSITREHADLHVAIAIKKDEFAARHSVKEFKFTPHNVGKLLRSSGARVEQANSVFREPRGLGLWRDTAFRPDFLIAFDRYDLWGRGGTPTILTGHPCGDPGQHRDIYDAIRGLGLAVETDGESFYGCGTYQVLVMRPLDDPRRN